jgi:hypothetical protein
MSVTAPVRAGRPGGVGTPSPVDDGIRSLPPTTLDELERIAALTTRVDRKYVLTPAATAALVRGLHGRVAALEIAGRRRFTYRSLYFDTADLQSYRRAAHGRRLRFKVRTRTYQSDQTCMLEVKAPGPRDATVKHRLPYDPRDHDRLTPAARAFVDEHTGHAGLASRLRPALTSVYTRSTLVDPTGGSRLTIDQRLECVHPGGTRVGLDGHVVVETKSTGAATPADRWLWRHGVRPSKISKYCVGMALLDPRLPANRWNRVLRRHFAWAPEGPAPPAATATGGPG